MQDMRNNESQALCSKEARGNPMSVQKLATVPARISGPVKLDLGCGDNKKDGFLGVDKFATASTDHVFDLLEFPWPVDDGAVEEAHCSHFFEHIPAGKRVPFMEELYRVLAKGAKAMFITPHAHSDRAIQDFSHEWPPIVPASYLYFNKGWRESNKLTHGAYAIGCDYDFGYGYSLDADITVRNAEYQQFAIKHYNNAASDLIVTLTKRG